MKVERKYDGLAYYNNDPIGMKGIGNSSSRMHVSTPLIWEGRYGCNERQSHVVIAKKKMKHFTSPCDQP